MKKSLFTPFILLAFSSSVVLAMEEKEDIEEGYEIKLKPNYNLEYPCEDLITELDELLISSNHSKEICVSQEIYESQGKVCNTIRNVESRLSDILTERVSTKKVQIKCALTDYIDKEDSTTFDIKKETLKTLEATLTLTPLVDTDSKSNRKNGKTTGRFSRWISKRTPLEWSFASVGGGTIVLGSIYYFVSFSPSQKVSDKKKATKSRQSQRKKESPMKRSNKRSADSKRKKSINLEF